MISNHPLNLLPPENRARVGYERLSRFFTLFHGIIAVILITGIILLLPTYFFLFFQNSGVAELVSAKRENVESDQARQSEERIKNLNTRLRRLEKEYSANPISVTRYVHDIISRVPDGITLAHFSYQKDSAAITLRGTADTRDNLLRFIASLRSHSEFQNIKSPVENILQERNISFTLSFSVIPPKQQTQP